MICHNRKAFYYDVSRSLAFGLCLVLVRQPIDAGADRHCGFNENQPNRGVCGRHLSALVSMVCKPLGGVNKRDVEIISDLQTLLNDSDLSSKSFTGSNDDDESSNEIDDSTSELSSYSPKFNTLSRLRPRRTPGADAGSGRRRLSTGHNIERRGIVCECCVHRCSLSELKLYCRYPHATPQPIARESPRLTVPAAVSPSTSSSSSLSPSTGFDDRHRALSPRFRR